MTFTRPGGALGLAVLIACTTAGTVSAQVPENIYQEMVKIDTADTSVSGPILEWIRKVK